MPRVRIVSEGGIGFGTRVLLEDGTEVPGVTAVALGPITPDAVTTAEISLAFVGLDVAAHPLLSLESLREAAAHHGLRLEPARAARSCE